jgi:glycosyl hydrolase family 131
MPVTPRASRSLLYVTYESIAEFSSEHLIANKLLQDGTSFWNGQTMERSEIIPQTSQNMGTGHLYYHFSLMTRHENPPNQSFEHQVAFFEVIP